MGVLSYHPRNLGLGSTRLARLLDRFETNKERQPLRSSTTGLNGFGPAPSTAVESTQGHQRQTRLCPDQVDELVAMYIGGASQRELAVQFEVNETTVRAHLRRRDVPKRPFRKLHGERLDRAVELYEGKSSLREVAENLGVSKETVRSGLATRGVRLRTS